MGTWNVTLASSVCFQTTANARKMATRDAYRLADPENRAVGPVMMP
jgi:hypothetical protein